MAEKQQEKRPIKRAILNRVRLLYVFFFVTGVCIVGKIVWLQYGPESSELKADADKRTYFRETIPADRGDIMAHDGRVMATSVPMFEIRMDFAAPGFTDEIFEKNVDSLAYCLSGFFRDKSKAAYKSMLRSYRASKHKPGFRNKRVAPRKVNYLELRELKKFPIFRLGANKGGFIAEQFSERVYPYGSLARRTIGIVNLADTKLGIEGAFDEQLRGTDGNTLTRKISGTFRVPVDDNENVEPENGMSVVTTLDVDIQDVAETALKNQLEYCQADWGSVVLMEVATGEIRAMANLTRYGEGRYSEDFNYAIGMRLEPGSTFKLASLIALLEDAGMSLDHMIDTEGGRAVINGKPVVDSHKEGIITLKRVFEVSSNIGFVKAVGEEYGKKPSRFVDFIADLGMGGPIGVQIPGEVSPVLPRPTDAYIKTGQWSNLTLMNLSYGYGLEITPLHTLSLYNAVANNGRMVRPMLVKRLVEYGRTVEEFETEVINSKICSQRTIDKVRESLKAVVDDGTASRLKNPYYTVAAKTGTAQIPLSKAVKGGGSGYVDRYGGRHYLATLVGYFPAEEPRYSCIVVMKTYYGNGRYNSYYGASLAAPVFKAVADRVYASHTDWQNTVKDNAGERASRPMQIKGGSARAIREVGDEFDVELRHSDRLKGWAQTSRDSTFVEVTALGGDDTTVPSVVGMGLKDALYLLESRGLRVSFSGKGRVVSQSLRAGGKVRRGDTIVLELR